MYLTSVPGGRSAVTDETPEQVAMGAATLAVRKILASAKNPRTLLGKASPTMVAFHAAYEAVSVYRETEAHERARRAGEVCRQCGLRP
jgi:hypothetical protein